MRFVLYQGVPHRSGKRRWQMREAGKRWPFYNGYVLTNDFSEAYKAFEEFVASAKQHYRESRR